jgi:alkanesulfonate monooxygenase SsuD/methylene tetrahydromethanopterin reductase-like flavin-dependent oxidoreductase (luciferase family)
MFRGIVTGKRQFLQPPVESMTGLWSYLEQAAVMEMLAYSFIGSKEKLHNKLSEFVRENGVDEIMATTHIYDHQARLKSFRLLAETMS